MKEVIKKLKEKLLQISNVTLLKFIGGVLCTELLFSLLAACSYPLYGGIIVSFVLVSCVTCILKNFSIKDVLIVVTGSIVASMLILLAIL